MQLPERLTPAALLILRLFAGALIMRYGLALFDHQAILGIASWLGPDHGFPAPVFMAYLGKAAEFFGGLLLVVGLFSRYAAALLIINMSTITFAIRSGLIFSDDEHPFLFLLLFLALLITGPGPWSLDHWLAKRPRKKP